MRGTTVTKKCTRYSGRWDRHMLYNKLGDTDLRVSVVAFGTAPLGGLFGAVDAEAATRAVQRAIEAGINLFDSSPYYGSAEERLGLALAGRRDDVIVATKAGRYGPTDFDFSAQAIRASVHRSLRRLQTDHLDVLQLHDIEFVDLEGPLGEGYAELVRLREEGKCRYIGMTGYPMATLRRAAEEVDLDVVLSYAHFTLLNTRLADELAPVCEQRGVGLINAAAVALGLLTRAGTRVDVPASVEVRAAAERVRALCAGRGVDVALLANQFSIQRSGAPTTVIGTVQPKHLDLAVQAATEPIDEELLAAVLAETADVRHVSWPSGLPQNN